eukprot:3288910-Heterocapsa_arctica.AAC.1
MSRDQSWRSSTSSLGIIPHFEAPAWLVRGEQAMPLITAGPLYYIPAHVSRTSAIDLRHDNK